MIEAHFYRRRWSGDARAEWQRRRKQRRKQHQQRQKALHVQDVRSLSLYSEKTVPARASRQVTVSWSRMPKHLLKKNGIALRSDYRSLESIRRRKQLIARLMSAS
jgi:hypothetical protein